MLRLALPTEPYWLALPRAQIRLQVRPLDAALYFAATNRALRRLHELIKEAADLVEAGASVAGLPNLDDDDARNGYLHFLEAQAIAEMGVIGWEGVGDQDGGELPFDRVKVPQLMRVHHVAEEFIALYLAPHRQLEAEKNVSVPAPSGTSAAGTPTANAAETTTPPVAGESPDSTATSAPTTSTPP